MEIEWKGIPEKPLELLLAAHPAACFPHVGPAVFNHRHCQMDPRGWAGKCV